MKKINIYAVLITLCMASSSWAVASTLVENGISVSGDEKANTLKVVDGSQVFNFKSPVKGTVCSVLKVPEWDSIFIGVQVSPIRFEILVVSLKDGAVSQIDLDSYFYSDDHIFPLSNKECTLTLAPLTFETTVNGKCVCSYPVVKDPKSAPPFDMNRASLSIHRLDGGKFEARSNR